MSSIQREIKAVQSYSELLELAEEVQDLYEEAGLPLPDRVKQLLSDSPQNGTSEDDSKSLISAYSEDAIARPEGVPRDWISIPARHAKAATLVDALLEQSDGEPVRPKTLVDGVAMLNPALTAGGVYNSGPRLKKAGVIESDDEGWKLLKPRGFPRVVGDRLWGPVDCFQSQEIAYYRRQILKRLLEKLPRGLQLMQIVDQLHAIAGLSVPFSKDIIKEDLKCLEESGEVKKLASSKKFVLAERGEQEQ